MERNNNHSYPQSNHTTCDYRFALSQHTNSLHWSSSIFIALVGRNLLHLKLKTILRHFSFSTLLVSKASKAVWLNHRISIVITRQFFYWLWEFGGKSRQFIQVDDFLSSCYTNTSQCIDFVRRKWFWITLAYNIEINKQ